MEQQTQEKDTCKDILDRVKEVLGSERHVRNIFNRVWRLSLYRIAIIFLKSKRLYTQTYMKC